ncbi:MAG: glycine cleavage system aminomethyltransferase GcvT [Schleiferiaceae bacterium]|jgi:aminomethyltransferase|nr:glycine cleavage system aminomethyltransferase GcvT [Schleiferiaceae bacterium]
MELKKTAFYDKLIEAGAKMVPFAGYEMAVQFEGLVKEHHNVRENVGSFDVSHMGEFFVKGKEALNLVERITSNDATKLTPGKIQYSCMPNDQGGIVDDLLVYCISEEEYMLVVNGACLDKDWAWVNKHNTFDCTIENRSDEISLLAVQGPKAAEALQQFTDVNLSEITYYTFTHGTFCGINNILISATGYTGSGGFEIYMPNSAAHTIWDALKDAGIKPAGLGARDTLRLEMGFCLYGNDIDDTTSPLEAGLGWITKFTKDFVNSDYLAKQKEEGITRRLVAFELLDRGVPRQGYDITDAEGNKIGNVTSGTMSPSTGKAIGMGYVPKPMMKADTEIYIAVRKKLLKAKVVKLPFYKA